jgi:O-antigen/teichoic acid export membrane protein
LEVKNSKAVEELMRITTYYVLGLSLVGLGIALFSPEVIHLLAPEAYERATIVVSWVVLGYLFMGLYFPPMNTMSLVVGDTKRIGICTTTAALTNIGLNVFFIPRFGMIAAAVTTTVTYFILFVALYLLAHQRQRLPYEWRRIVTIIIASTATFLVGSSAATYATSNGFLVKIASLLVLPAILWVAGFFNSQEIGLLPELWTRVARVVWSSRGD